LKKPAAVKPSTSQNGSLLTSQSLLGISLYTMNVAFLAVSVTGDLLEHHCNEQRGEGILLFIG
jgi:hypothetical protein